MNRIARHKSRRSFRQKQPPDASFDRDFFLFRRRWPSSAFKISFGKGASKSSAILIVSP